jgi:Holliday junction resolvase RusA-like endonuclease
MEWTFHINPTAASRARVSFKGGHGYFVGPYKRFRDEMKDIVPQVIGDHPPFEGDVSVTVEFMAKRPKTTKLSSPRGDIDNYLKAIFDALNGLAFIDDKQIVICHARKSWTPSHEDEGYIKVSIKEATL